MGKLIAHLTDEGITRVFRQGRTLFFDTLAAKVAPNREGVTRIGFSFSKKKVPLAVSRNRLRRQILGALSGREGMFAGYDMIFYVPKKLEKREKIDISGFLDRLAAALHSKP